MFNYFISGIEITIFKSSSTVFQELQNTHILKQHIERLEERVKALEDKVHPLISAAPPVAVCPPKLQPGSKPAQEKADDDEDVDLFGSDSEASGQK